MTKPASDKIKKSLTGLVFSAGAAVFWISLWAIAARIVGLRLILPSPWETLLRLWELMGTAHFYAVTFSSLGRVMLGTVLAMLCGILLAAFAAACAPVDRLISPLMTVIRSTPVVSFIIVAFLWLGNAALPVFISFLMVLPIIYVNVLEGIKSASPDLLRMAKVFRLPLPMRLRRIYAPSAAPYFLSASKSSLGLAWKSGIAAEVLVFTARSIGAEMALSKAALETTDLFAWTAIIVILSLLIEKIFSRVLTALGKLPEVKMSDDRTDHH